MDGFDRVGDMLTRGISGGERKRVSIGVELVTNPTVLFVDEPTSGLDSTTSLSTIQLLKRLAAAGRTVVMTIHSPSSRIFELFDSLLLLSHGKVAYLGRADCALSYFDSLNYRAPPFANAAEFFRKRKKKSPGLRAFDATVSLPLLFVT